MKQSVKNLTLNPSPKERDFKLPPLFWRGVGGEVKALAMTK
ncbi:MAG: hypothetical protein ACYDEC_07490 [Bacteroidia bacterium]